MTLNQGHNASPNHTSKNRDENTYPGRGGVKIRNDVLEGLNVGSIAPSLPECFELMDLVPFPKPVTRDRLTEGSLRFIERLSLPSAF